jgi:hypothetical protein
MTQGRPPSPTPRLPDWPERLAALVEARRDAPFAWGVQDCMIWAADAVLACTGEDPAAPWRGSYATEAEALAIMAGFGGQVPMIEAVQAARGAAECPLPFAQRGDTALVRQGNQLVMAVVLDGMLAAAGDDGLLMLPIDTALRVWVT